jgi:hypothetical protein
MRFFSRDMYNQLPSASPSPTPSLGPNTTHMSDLPPDRSESPYEIRLSPMVTKRMSLDAFGTPSPPPVSQPPSSGGDIEEVLEEGGVGEEGEEAGGESAGYLHTTLSTIEEGLSAAQESVNDRSRAIPLSLSQARTVLDQTFYYTPFSAKLDHRGLPLPSSEPEIGACSPRQHLSCPPLPASELLLGAHSGYTRSLESELQCARNVIQCLEEELSRVTNATEGHRDSVMQQKAWESKIKAIQDLIQERDEGEHRT